MRAGAKLALYVTVLSGGGIGMAGATVGVLGNALGVLGQPIAFPMMRIILTYGMFIAFSCCFVGIVAIPSVLVMAISARKRCIDASAGRFGIKIGRGRRKEWVPTDLMWSANSANRDAYGWYSSQQPLVRLRAEQTVVCCGFEEQARVRWIGLLQLIGVNERHPIRRDEIAKAFVFPIMAGVGIGLVVGGGLAAAWGARIYLFAGLMLGAIDSIAYAVIRRGVKTLNPTTLKMVSGKLFPISTFLFCFLLGMKLGMSLITGLTLGLLNGSVGLLMSAKLINVWRELANSTLNDDAAQEQAVSGESQE